MAVTKAGTDEITTLRGLRDARDMTAREVADAVAAKLGKPSRDFSGILHLEKQGLVSAGLFQALAEIYRVDVSVIVQFAKAAYEEGKESRAYKPAAG